MSEKVCLSEDLVDKVDTETKLKTLIAKMMYEFTKTLSISASSSK